MWRYLVGAVATLLLIAGGALWWRSTAVAGQALPGAPLREVSAVAADETPEPPAASDKTREQKRFSRNDKDKDGRITRDEYLAARRKAFAKLDVNGDGRLTFDEWAIKAETKFGGADADKSGSLTATEFATTRVVRKAKPRVACPPPQATEQDDS